MLKTPQGLQLIRGQISYRKSSGARKGLASAFNFAPFYLEDGGSIASTSKTYLRKADFNGFKSLQSVLVFIVLLLLLFDGCLFDLFCVNIFFFFFSGGGGGGLDGFRRIRGNLSPSVAKV